MITLILAYSMTALLITAFSKAYKDVDPGIFMLTGAALSFVMFGLALITAKAAGI